MRTLTIFCLIFGIFGKNAHSCPCEFKKVEENKKNAVLVYVKFRVKYYINEKTYVFIEKIGRGSGFVIDKNGLIGTANHNTLKKHGKYYVLIQRPEGNLVKKAEIILKKPEYDFAILKINYKFKSQVKFNTKQLQSGEPLYCINYMFIDSDEIPHNVRRNITRGYFIRTYRATQDFLTLYKLGKISFQISNITASKGASGAPVFDKNGFFVGLVFMTYHELKGYPFTFYIGADLIKKTIDSL